MPKTNPPFPAPALPEDPADQKLLGLYGQRQEGLWLQRVRIPGGRVTSAQLRALATAAERLGARPALHLTTRQCVEIHGLAPERVPELHRMLAETGLGTLGAAGDTSRNCVVDPVGGLARGTFDLFPLAETVDVALRRLDGIWSLPRKFKVSFSGSAEGSMRPYTTDLGVIARDDGSLRAVVAGSLGARPAAGVPFPGALSARDVVALAVAAVRLHAQEGDRERRSRARLRHVRERLGDEAFLERLTAAFSEERERRRGGVNEPARAAEDGVEHLRLSVPHGDLGLDEARRLADAVDGAGGEIRFGIEHDVHLFGVPLAELPERIRPWARAGRIVSCPGAHLCSKAAGTTREAADALAPLAGRHGGLLFAISGCPNSCSHAAVADVGVIASRKREGQAHRTVYRVLLDGGRGGDPRIARTAAEDVALEDLASTVEWLLRDAPAGGE